MKIIDATGTGNGLKVGADNRLQARVINEPEVVHNGELGNAYNFNTGLISITADATLCYLKNNSDNSFVFTAVALGIGDGITYTDFPYLTCVRNPTGGDLISDATAVDMNQNRNFGSSKSASVNAYKGKVGGTLTGGNDIALFQLNKTGRSYFAIDFIIPKGGSFGFKLDANVSSGSANCYLAVIGYFKDDEDAQ